MSFSCHCHLIMANDLYEYSKWSGDNFNFIWFYVDYMQIQPLTYSRLLAHWCSLESESVSWKY